MNARKVKKIKINKQMGFLLINLNKYAPCVIDHKFTIANMI